VRDKRGLSSGSLLNSRACSTHSWRTYSSVALKLTIFSSRPMIQSYLLPPMYCRSTAHEPPPNGQRTCLDCGTSLSKPDDVVIAVLNPSDDYKTSVLSGLSPSIIIEICTRGLTFWTYQVTQEMSVPAPSLQQDAGLAMA